MLQVLLSIRYCFIRVFFFTICSLALLLHAEDLHDPDEDIDEVKLEADAIQ